MQRSQTPICLLMTTSLASSGCVCAFVHRIHGWPLVRRISANFDLQFNLLSWTAHHEHVDSEHAARVFKHLRELACELKALGIHIVFIFADDKCSAKIGEPGDPVAADSCGAQQASGWQC